MTYSTHQHAAALQAVPLARLDPAAASSVRQGQLAVLEPVPPGQDALWDVMDCAWEGASLPAALCACDELRPSAAPSPQRTPEL